MWFLAYFILHLIVYSVVRLEFLIWNWASLKTLSLSEILWAFLNGIRFDLSVLAISVGLCFLGLLLLPRLLRQVWIWFFILLNATFYLLNLADAELFNFTAKRFSASSFFLVGEGSVGNLIFPYIPLATFSIALVGIYIYLAYRVSSRFTYGWDWKGRAAAVFGVLVLGVLFSRGGLQHKPLTFVDAKLFNSSYANNLVLNSTFTVVKSLGKKSLLQEKFYEQDEMLSLLNPQDLKPSPIKTSRLNVVLVILESFSKEYLTLKDPEVAPYFNQLRLQSADFPKAYANGRRSIEGMAAILSGIPALMEEPFINSEFSANEIIGLGTLLGAQGYQTSFFHGAANGSMHFDRFSKSVGIENYFGKNEYPHQQDNDGTWGIYDEPFLQWTCGKLTEFSQPFFTTIFTLSSHQPYNLPEAYRGEYQDDRHPILKTIRYTDMAVQRFMECAAKQSWYQNTLFVFTADHTGPELGTNPSFSDRYAVPLVFFSPMDLNLKSINTEQWAQHIDILPSLLEILNVPYKNKNYLARSLVQDGSKFIALYSDGHYELIGDVKDSEQQLKAVKQYFSEGLYDNRLYYPSK